MRSLYDPDNPENEEAMESARTLTTKPTCEEVEIQGTLPFEGYGFLAPWQLQGAVSFAPTSVEMMNDWLREESVGTITDDED